MKRELLTHYISVNLSRSDRQALEQLAEERGATLSGVIRKLIREAALSASATGQLSTQSETEGGTNYAISR